MAKISDLKKMGPFFLFFHDYVAEISGFFQNWTIFNNFSGLCGSNFMFFEEFRNFCFFRILWLIFQAFFINGQYFSFFQDHEANNSEFFLNG